jgi:hypothetical protein
VVRARVLGGAALVLLATTVCAADAAPTTFTLEFSGAHILDRSLPAGVRHEGRFTASPPLCTSGTALDIQDVQVEPLSVMRRHTCDDGSGSFVAFMPGVLGEHGGSGSWKIVDGAGRYAELRGVGTYSGHIVSGDPGVPATVAYTTSWQGVVDFDAVAPTVTVQASAKKLRKPPRTYSIRTVLDAHEGPVEYSIDIRSGTLFLAFKQGTAASGRIATTLRVRPPRRVRSAVVIVTVADAVGNEGVTKPIVKLR